MLIKFLRFLSSIFLTTIFSFGIVYGNSSNPPSQDCASCHTGNINTGDGSISLSGLPLSYFPGQTYNLTLTILGTNSRGFGFQLSPSVNGTTSGTLTAISSDMAIENGAAEHRGTSSSGVWNFQWTAPATDEGEVSFDASGVATAGSSGNDGDFVYTISKSIPSFPHAFVDWNASTGGVIFSSPAVGSDGSIYIGSNDNMLHAFNTDGSIKWTFPAANWIDSTPAVSSDGTIYVGSWDNKIYAIDSDNGDKIWEYETNSYVVASPAIGADGKIYVGSKDSIFYAFENNGSVAWEYFAGQPISSSAALGQDGTIYFGDENGTFHAVNPDGTAKWTYEVEDIVDTNKSILSSPALDLSGNIYFGSGNGNCYSILDNGESASLNWSYPTSDRVDASPVLGINDDVFFVSRDGYMRSLSTLSGGLNWEVFVGDVFYSSPVVDQNGRTYVIGYTGGGENHLFAFDSDGTKAWDTNDTDCPFVIGGIVDSSLALSSDGKLYYGCYDNRIYCIDVGVSPASSDWPMFQRNGRRDGAWPSYLLEILASPGGVASISGEGIYNEGATATITVDSITDGYSFSHWTGGASGSENPLNLAINSSTSVTANFSLNQYSLSVNTGTGGSVTGNGTFDHGTDAPITATPQAGYYFSGWSGEGIEDNSSASTTVSMTGTRSVTASFTPFSYTISATVSPIGTGQVTGSGTYQFGDEANLTAASNSDEYTFLSWTGDINSTDNPLTITSIDSNLTLTANFSLQSHNLVIISGEGGSVEGAGSFEHGSLQVINATPNEGYFFEGWTGSGIADPNSATTTIEMTEDRNITASFSIKKHSLSIISGEGGNVSGEGNYTHGSTPSIIATPDQGFIFSGWFGDGVTNPDAMTTTVSMTEERIVTGTFTAIEYGLVLNSSIGGSVRGEGNYSHGEVVTITAIPDSGYQFDSWSGDIEGNLSSPSRSFLMESNKSITANFIAVEENHFVLTILSNPQSGGSSTGSGSYLANTSVPISAMPTNGYEFVNWTGQGIEDSNSSDSNLVLSESQIITANFQKESFLLHIEIDGEGNATGDGYYEYGTERNITAVPANGYTFYKWEGTGIANPGSTTTTITISNDLNITAVFKAKEFNLNLPTSTGGQVQGGGIYPYGSVVEISAIPQPGYSFIGWTGGDFHDATAAFTTLTLSEDTNATAQFEPIFYSITVNSSKGGNVSDGGEFEYGYNYSLTAIADEGHSFSRWEGAGVKKPSFPFTSIQITEDRNVTAIFEINSHQLTILSAEGGSSSGTGVYDWNSEVSISAIAKDGYEFSHWEGDDIIDPNSSSTKIIISEDVEIKPVFSNLTLANEIDDIVEIAPDWYGSSWFGTFFQNESGWSYHYEFGWIFPVIHDSANIWFWHSKLGWVWVNQETFSDNYIWSKDSNNWLYWDNSDISKLRYFNYDNEEWNDWQR